jgi:hypothetical protein
MKQIEEHHHLLQSENPQENNEVPSNRVQVTATW